MRSNPRWSRLALLVTSILFAGGALAPALADYKDDPEYGSVYGRIRYLESGLTLLRAGEGTVTEGNVNDPVAPGDRLTTDDGRAEIGLADGSVLWLDQGTRLDVRNLSDINNRYEKTNLFALESGAIRIDASDPDSKDRTFRVDTEAGSIYLLSGGSFRIENEDGATTVYSFRGVAELSGDEDSVLVRTGERGSVQPGRLPSEPRRFNTARLDDFDRFVDLRQEAFLRNAGDRAPQEMAEEVPDEVQPYVSELSYYGSWHRAPSYGWVWRPVYHGSWGPYVNGYWSWCRGGWVWVSYDPWGWAPYHYGRWDFAVDIGWVWIPGRVWSGAWVSFAVGSSYVGWSPLNYYNRPVFHDVTIVNVVNVNVTRLQPRGWRFVNVDRFADRRAAPSCAPIACRAAPTWSSPRACRVSTRRTSPAGRSTAFASWRLSARTAHRFPRRWAGTIGRSRSATWRRSPSRAPAGEARRPGSRTGRVSRGGSPRTGRTGRTGVGMRGPPRPGRARPRVLAGAPPDRTAWGSPGRERNRRTPRDPRRARGPRIEGPDPPAARVRRAAKGSGRRPAASKDRGASRPGPR